MDKIKLLQNMQRVKAPPDFEENLWRNLEIEKRKKVKARRLQFSFAGAFATLAAVVIIINVFIVPRKESIKTAALGKKMSSGFQKTEERSKEIIIPITEPVHYLGEIRMRSQEPQAIYILEQVSDKVDREIIY